MWKLIIPESNVHSKELQQFERFTMRKGKKEIPYYILQILLEHSDEKHPISSSEIRYFCVQQYEQNFDRRTLYSSIKMLNELGYSIIYLPSPDNGYYISDRSRIFSNDEVKTLIKAIISMDDANGKQKYSILRKLIETQSKYQQIKLIKEFGINYL